MSRQIGNITVLDTNDFNRTCPSFYAEHPKSDVSDKYSFINSREVAVQLFNMGWYPVKASESRCVDKSNVGFTKHMIRFANNDVRVGQDRIELVFRNSHNRSAAAILDAGIFRLICSNGMVVKSNDFGNYRFRHVGNLYEMLKQAVAAIAQNATRLGGVINTWKTIELTKDEQGVYAASALEALYGLEPAPFTAPQLLVPRRLADRNEQSTYSWKGEAKPDLWTTFNVVQENLLKGGMKGRASTGRRYTTRAVTSIDKDVKLNQALWTLTERMAALKS